MQPDKITCLNTDKVLTLKPMPDPTFPFSALLDGYAFSAHWSTGLMYAVALCGIFPSMKQWETLYNS